MKKGYYITDIFTSAGRKIGSGEKMEPGAEGSHDSELTERRTFQTYVNGNDDSIIVKCVEEKVSYMADYEYDENYQIVGVRYDPVPVERKEEYMLLFRRKEISDTFAEVISSDLEEDADESFS